MRLYDHPLSSYAQKVRIALREKRLPFEQVRPDDFGTGRTDTDFAAANPRREVPTLITDEGVPIFESTVIVDYLERIAPDPALFPADPLRIAQARMIETICDAQYEAINWAWGEILWFRRAEGALADHLRAQARRDTETIQTWLAARLGAGQPWFNGATFGLADAAVAPVMNRSVYYGLGPPKGSRLATWHARVSARPAVAETFAEFGAAAARMADHPDLYTTGGRKREYRDHRLEWLIRSGGLTIVTNGLEADNIRFSWPGGHRGATALDD